MASKAKCQRRHAKHRAAARYDLFLTDQNLEAIVVQIQTGKAHFVGRQSNRVTHWDVQVEGKLARVVYDKARGQITTFLPPELAGQP